MKLTITQQQMKTMVMELTTVKKTECGIMPSIQLQTKDNTLIMTLDNGVIRKSLSMYCSVEESGNAVIDTSFFKKLITKMPKSEFLFISSEDNKMKVEGLKSKFDFTIGLDYHLEAIETFENEISFDAETLSSAIKQVVYASAKEGSHVHKSLCLELRKDGSYRLASLDGSRLAVKTINSDKIDSSIETQILIPQETTKEIMQIIKYSSDNKINIGIGQYRLKFSNCECELYSKIIDGRFPDFDRILVASDKVNYHLTLEKSSFKENLLALKKMTNSSYFKLSVKNQEYECVIEEDDTRYALSEECIGDDINFNFNITFLIDYLKILEETEVKISFTSENYPATFDSFNSNGDRLQYLVMPIITKCS